MKDLSDDLECFLIEPTDGSKVKLRNRRRKNKTINGELHRECSFCRIYKPINNFGKTKTIGTIFRNVSFHFQSRCRECANK